MNVYKITMNGQEVSAIIEVLKKHPMSWELANKLIYNISHQVAEQDKEKELVKVRERKAGAKKAVPRAKRKAA